LQNVCSAIYFRSRNKFEREVGYETYGSLLALTLPNLNHGVGAAETRPARPNLDPQLPPQFALTTSSALFDAGTATPEILEMFPRLTEAQVALASIYAKAVPQRGRPKRPQPRWGQGP
jgi:hypothetical protein